MKSISALSCPTARPAEAFLGVRRPEEARRPEAPGSGRLSKPAVDEYIPEAPQEASGRYWPGRDENGRPRICFDGQPPAADSPQKGDRRPEAPQEKNGAKEPAPKEERCAGSTDQVDREIRRLKREKAELERQIAAEPREDKRRSLEKQLDQVEAQLRQKDNDAYRKRHTKFS